MLTYNSYMCRLALITLLLLFATLSCPSWAAKHPPPNKEEVYGYYLLAHIPPLPPMVPGAFGPPNETSGDLEDAFEGDYFPDLYDNVFNAFDAALRKDKRDVRAYVGLAICEERAGSPADAIQDYRTALELAPTNTRARQGLRRAELFVRIGKLVGRDIPKGQRVLQVAPIRTGRRTDWVVLAASPQDPDDEDGRKSASLDLFTVRGRHVHRLSLVRLIAEPGADDEFVDPDFTDLFLRVANVDGTGTETACVFGNVQSPPFLEPIQLDLFKPLRGSLRRTFEYTSDWPIWVQDINHDGRCEIGVYDEIGEMIYEVEEPRWMDIYAFRGGRYRLSDKEFPAAYRLMPQALRQVLHHHPFNGDIWEYLGKAYDIEREHRRAREAYRRSTMPEPANLQAY